MNTMCFKDLTYSKFLIYPKAGFKISEKLVHFVLTILVGFVPRTFSFLEFSMPLLTSTECSHLAGLVRFSRQWF